MPGILEVLGGGLRSLPRSSLVGNGCHLLFGGRHSASPRETVPSLKLASRRRYFIHVKGLDGTSLRRLNSLERVEGWVSMDLIEPLCRVKRLVLGIVSRHCEHVDRSAA